MQSGLVAPSSALLHRSVAAGSRSCLNVIANEQGVPEPARTCLLALGAQLRRIKEQILEFDRMITAWHRGCETSRRLDEIPGGGLSIRFLLLLLCLLGCLLLLCFSRQRGRFLLPVGESYGSPK